MEDHRDSMENKADWVLLVEDNDDEANLALRAFGRTSIAAEIVHAANADEAMKTLQARPNPPRAAFLDVKLPGMSGLDLLDWIRSQGNLKHIPVIVLVGSGDHNTFLKAVHIGANSLVRKEVDYDLYMQNIGLAYRYWMCVNVPAMLL